MKTDWQEIRRQFQKIWGYDDFRSPQGEIIQTLLARKDALVVMPTGGGKSVCFQLPALLQDGLTLVISPLVALMENQVQELCSKKLPAALLHNEIPRSLRQQTLKAIEQQTLRLLYLSPETLFSSPVWERISQPQIKINGLILDEAHCLTQWGYTFRPSYCRLGVVRSTLLKNKPLGTKIAVAAFTATADPITQRILEKSLQLENPEKFLLSPYRSNLDLQVKISLSPRCRRHQLLHFLKLYPKQSGLIYVRSRRESEDLFQLLQSLNYRTAAYHAGLSSAQRRQIEKQWLEDHIQFVVTTSAFGMGINKSDVRWIVHFQAPQLLSEYLQEVGRGGRDGKFTQALTLISEPTGILDPSDRQKQQLITKQRQKQTQQAQQIISKIPVTARIENVINQFPSAEISLAVLYSHEQLEWLDPFTYRLIKASRLISQPIPNLMASYLTTRKCRWQFLLSSFGFYGEAEYFTCGHCDYCRKK
ncbi:recombinase RecQ [Aphanothece hegewaldii CCALA 016]|uniref:DNA 3'-5' helicase n=1 Tax=Aphanothece hegewaldii CCALA 016 TaxID=2107694 RepID=A0A2T1M3L4_9CHRO|nr:RecQ family ATP-dependent DNA helicase [Aphanothece hegewaldii]PSF39415.1 recombinase RecQ [Aphanothece hegewaldii CCALA 016]